MDIRAINYSAGIMSESSWFLEFKKMVQLKNDGVSEDDIKDMCLNQNLFGMLTANRVKRTYGYLARRVRTMDDSLVSIFCSSDLATQKLINFITVVRGDRLLFEFLNEVYREKHILGFDELSISDVNTFFREKSIESEALAGWKDTTFVKVRGCFFNFMTDSNLLRKEKKTYYITPPILDIALERYLEANGETHIIKAITGVR